MAGAFSSSYQPLTGKAIKELIAPHSWIAAVGPVLIGGALCLATSALPWNVFDLRALIVWLFMLVTAIALQSAVNTYNDYQDFISGLDTKETLLDETDASIIYNHLNPRDALKVVIGCLVVAGCFGMAVVVLSSWVTLAMGLVGLAAVLLYSGGPKPLAQLPLGELVSGFVMGIIIVVATYYAITGTFSWFVLAACAPSLIGIALIMQTNNTCDIERDTEVGRRTLPVILGRKASVRTMVVLMIIVYLWMLVQLLMADMLVGIFVVAVAILISSSFLYRIATGPYNLKNRRVMMRGITNFNKILMVAWALALIVGGIAHG